MRFERFLGGRSAYGKIRTRYRRGSSGRLTDDRVGEEIPRPRSGVSGAFREVREKVREVRFPGRTLAGASADFAVNTSPRGADCDTS